MEKHSIHRIEFTFWREDVLQKRVRINEKGPCQKCWYEDTHSLKMPRIAPNLQFLRNEHGIGLVQLLRKWYQRPQEVTVPAIGTTVPNFERLIGATFAQM